MLRACSLSLSLSLSLGCFRYVSGNTLVGVTIAATDTDEAQSSLHRLSLVQDPNDPAPDPTRTRGIPRQRGKG